MKLVSVERTGKTPAFVAVFDLGDKKKTVRFGTPSNYVSNPKKTKEDRTNYIKRHRVNENWRDATSRGALSRFLLWGDSRSLAENIKAYKKRFNI